LDLNKKDPNPSGWLPVSGLLSTTAIPDRKGRRQRHQADNPKEVHAKLDADRTTGGIVCTSSAAIIPGMGKGCHGDARWQTDQSG
jgi:hypothetical protein